jgi:uncharacterized membrane protein YgaE (UPF0421/DUF939 family)
MESPEIPADPFRPEGGRSKEQRGMVMAVGTALGVSLGAAIGTLLNNFALWMGISIAVGVGVGALVDAAIYRGRRNGS